MKDRGHIDDLRDRVGGDTEGFQIHGTPGGEAPALPPEQIPLCDALAEFLRDISALDIAVVIALKANDYKIRQTARAVGVSHSTVQRTIARLPLARKRATSSSGKVARTRATPPLQ